MLSEHIYYINIKKTVADATMFLRKGNLLRQIDHQSLKNSLPPKGD